MFETIVFSVIVPGAVTIWIPRDVLGIWGQAPDSWSARHVAAIVPLMLGLSIYLRCLWEFAARGRGIPAPVDHPKQLVVTGLYQYVRNPMYVGVLLFLLGEALFFGSWPFLLYAIGWLLFVHVNVLWYEEPNLRRKFGRSYEEYTAAVHRWIPGKQHQPRPKKGYVPSPISKPRWMSTKGDDWWYEAPWGKAEASGGLVLFRIESIRPSDGNLTESRLHEVIASMWENLGDVSLLCYLTDVTRPLLEGLSRKGLVHWELVTNPYSQDARIVRVEPMRGTE